MNESISNTTQELPVNITEKAIQEITRLMGEKNIPQGHGLRVGVKGGGCAGMSYILGFDQKKENDREYDIHGMKVFIEPSHLIYLLGIQLDFQDGLNARGFIFNNPNATKTCGCGSSFSA